MNQFEYVVVKLNKYTHQMSLEDLFSMTDTEFETKFDRVNSANFRSSSTRTYVTKNADKLCEEIDFSRLIGQLVAFNDRHKDLLEADRHSLYRTFHIPKKSGGLRKIDAPCEELTNALRELKYIIEHEFHVLYHTAAYAYVKGRSTIDAVKKHQVNESKWFAKFDLSNFFGSTTIDFVMAQLSKIYPFSRIVKYEDGERALRTAFGLAFLDGGLPQGTPISPIITNIIMIPIDYEIFNTLRNYESNKYVYTRYADDFIISSKYKFDYKDIENLIIMTLAKYNAPFKLNTEKTRFGSSAGSNWNLGVMLNKDNEMTIGYKNKRSFQAMLFSYAMDKKDGKTWELHDIQILEGYRNYYSMIEREAIAALVNKVGNKVGVDIRKEIKKDLKEL